eukprot:1673310-Amphidinium_carterae.1
MQSCGGRGNSPAVGHSWIVISSLVIAWFIAERTCKSTSARNQTSVMCLRAKCSTKSSPHKS